METPLELAGRPTGRPAGGVFFMCRKSVIARLTHYTHVDLSDQAAANGAAVPGAVVSEHGR